MSDTIAPTRAELPVRTDLARTDPARTDPAVPRGLDDSLPPTSVVESAAPAPGPFPASGTLSSPADQMARLEDKTSRIEEKLARSEAATQRVIDRFETASHRMSEVALQTDLVAVRSDVRAIARRVRSLPGVPALILTALVSAVVTAVFVVLVIRYLPGLAGR